MTEGNASILDGGPRHPTRGSSKRPIRWPTCKNCSRAAAIITDPNLPAFTGGLVGYAGYDTIRYYEGEKASPTRRRMTAGCPICCSGCTANW